jgi:TatA/E family protein of Tat protein translocase
MPWGLTPVHLIVILVIVLIVVGPGKLPDTGAAIGKALRGFKDAVDGNDQAGSSQHSDQAPAPQGQPLQSNTGNPPATGYPPQYAQPLPQQYPPQQYPPQQYPPQQYPPQQYPPQQYPPQQYPPQG